MTREDRYARFLAVQDALSEFDVGWLAFLNFSLQFWLEENEQREQAG